MSAPFNPDDADAIICKLQAERNALKAECERLRAALKGLASSRVVLSACQLSYRGVDSMELIEAAKTALGAALK